MKPSSFEESVSNFREWLAGTKFQDFRQKQRVWLLHNVKWLVNSENPVAADCPEYAKVLFEMVDPGSPLPPFKKEWWMQWDEKKFKKSKTEKVEKKTKEVFKPEIEPLF